MRLLVRLSVVGGLTVVFLIVLAIRSARNFRTLEQQETGDPIVFFKLD
jgi:hypothetical protein